MRHLRGVLCLSALALAGCQTDSRQQVLATDRSQVELRSISTRAFDTNDRRQVFRAVIGTFQDLGFVVDRADETLGTVSATKLQNYVLRMTVTVRARGATQVAVRASGQYNLDAISDPKPYQDFFNALEQALFLTANQID
ncbi:hypothetical protein [Roseomonas elaeocarpi]|uniref:DUF4410 domain-containing protein n=1 Tax=Roseomonas elaeocarpi TaxID=907779 RepID=A0ABV6JSH9_9PROT